MSKTGAIAGIVTGTVVTVTWKNVPALSGVVYELVPAFVAAFTVAVAVSVVARPVYVRQRQRASGSAEVGTTRSGLIVETLDDGVHPWTGRESGGDPSTTKVYDRRGYKPEKSPSFFANF